MKHLSIIHLGAAALLSTLSAMAQVPQTEQRILKDTLHGEVIADPYRWLEGDERGEVTPEVAAWTEEQNAHTRAVLDALPGREALENRLRELLEVPALSTPVMAGTRYFYSRRESGQPQPVHYMREGLKGNERVLLDPQAIDASGLTTIAWTRPSNDGSKLAFGIYRSGNENYTLHVLDIDSGDWLAEEIPGKVTLTRWLPDDSGFYYKRLEDVDDPYSSVQKMHRLGTHHRQDPVLFRQRDLGFFYGNGKTEKELAALAKTWGPSAMVSRDNRWMLVYYATGTDSQDLWIASLEDWRQSGDLVLTPMVLGEQGTVGTSRFVGDTLYLQHNFRAPLGKISRIDLASPSIADWDDLVAEHSKKVIAATDFARDRIAVDYLFNASTRIELFTYDGSARGTLELPGIGSAGISSSEDRNEAFLAFSSFDTPNSIYRVNLNSGERELWQQPDVPVDSSAVTVKQVWYPSRDGTQVSMFLVHRKDLVLDGSNPTWLYGYGGFDVSLTPAFSSTLFPWFEGGGVYAVANLRGGGEYGAEWHEAGMLAQKQNVFDDFVAAAEWLIREGYTNPQHLGISGGSNGGLLTGAVLTQRPDLFSAVISGVPLLDMLRYQNFLMARYWVPEYGSAEDPEQFGFLRAYSPYHNVEKGTAYPATLLTAGENDARVHPLHARKMAALLQERTSADPAVDPILLWVNRDAGHGQGKPLELQVRDIADQRIFMMWQLGMLDDG